MRNRSILASLAVLAAPAWATTLQKLSLDDMIGQSTSIVRAKVTGSSTSMLGRDIYTYYQFQVLETLKAGPAQPSSAQSSSSSVAVPGGVARGLRQIAAGAPALSAGQEYVLFLWTSRSGLTQVIGLSQGLFTVMQNEAGDTVLVRPAASELMLDQAGKVVNDQGVTMKLTDLRTEIQKVAGK
jgi:hypothetical protein